MTALKGKFTGSLLGTLVGDALGLPVEGCSQHDVRTRFEQVDQTMDARIGKGTYTDDTEMIIATAESLIASN